MKMLKKLRIAIPLAAGFMLLATGQPVWAEETGCIVTLDPEQLPYDVGVFDGKMSCENWSSMTGSCFLDPEDDGSEVACTMFPGSPNAFIVHAIKDAGAVVWWTNDEGETGLGIDKVILDNSAPANGCLQNNKFDAVSGSIKFVKSNLEIQSTKGVELCADEEGFTAPPPPEVAEVLPNCDFDSTLDDTGIECPVYDATDLPLPDGVAIGDQKPVVVCNFEKDKKDWGVTDGTDVCCQCGIVAQQTACVVTEDETVDNACTKSMTVDPTQAVEFTLFRSDGDPCTWLRSSRGWVQWCW
jgi:hypothetical protein